MPAKRKSKLKTIVAHPMSFVLQLADLSMGQIPGRSREGAKRLLGLAALTRPAVEYEGLYKHTWRHPTSTVMPMT